MTQFTGQAGERTLIASLRARAGHQSTGTKAGLTGQRRNLAVGIGDDCAVLNIPRGQQIVVTTDLSLENVHFRRDWHSPEAVGHRCLARGLSDLAAMGARPLAAFLSLALPPGLMQTRNGATSWRDRFFDGLFALGEEFRVPLAGGDTAGTPRAGIAKNGHKQNQISDMALADIVLVGNVPRGRALLRSGAQPGDRIYVTGGLGGAAAELKQLIENASSLRPRAERSMPLRRSEASQHPHLFPQPRIDVGAWLVRNRRATAAIDISDGLSTDLDHLCEESRVAATVDAATLPIHPLALRASGGSIKRAMNLALHGGEDYELLFTASEHVRIPRQICGVPVTWIGSMRRSSPRTSRIMLIERTGNGQGRERPLLPKGWEHYR